MKTKIKSKLYRQGDVLIQTIDEIPASAQRVETKRGQRIILAYGEATGHHHSLDIKDADWWKQQVAPPNAAPAAGPREADSDTQYLEIKGSGATVTHQEHAPIELPPGKYRVIQQREYSPEEIRTVRD